MDYVIVIKWIIKKSLFFGIAIIYYTAICDSIPIWDKSNIHDCVSLCVFNAINTYTTGSRWFLYIVHVHWVILSVNRQLSVTGISNIVKVCVGKLTTVVWLNCCWKMQKKIQLHRQTNKTKHIYVSFEKHPHQLDFQWVYMFFVHKSSTNEKYMHIYKTRISLILWYFFRNFYSTCSSSTFYLYWKNEITAC